MTLYNNVGLISYSSKDSASKSTENRSSITPLSFDAPLPVKIHIKLILKETRVTGLHLCYHMCVGLQCGSIFIPIFIVGSERCMFYAMECVMAIQGHSRSVAAPGS